tara:strand:+ start:987 stop:1253 length:267 start_codon:yes stop_codon:yes gene_type:complete
MGEYTNDPNQRYGVTLVDLSHGLRDGTFSSDDVISCLSVRMTRQGVKWEYGGSKWAVYRNAIDQVRETGYLDVNDAYLAAKKSIGNHE